MAVTATFVLFVKFPVILFTAVVWETPPENPVPVGVVQVYVVPEGTVPFAPWVGETLNATPLQIVEVIALILAIGLIVTVTVKVFPVFPPFTGVTVYVAVWVVLVGLIKVPEIFVALLPEVPPVTAPVTEGVPHE